ncbi:hypothetical protein V8B55DRAFT_1593578 [Mucor lusitanicus]
MRFSINDPPPFKYKPSDFSGDSINANRCFYYLSLLERFVATTQDMPESVLKLYLVQAEYRYYRWISSHSYEKCIPPLDVAFFWQTHMLRPIQFEQDVARRIAGDLPNQYHQEPPPTLNGIAVPLKQIHEYQEAVPFTALRKWKKAMGEKEAYHLTKERLIESCSESCAEISCIICFIKMDVSWKDFVEWRLDHTIALACHRCSGAFTIKHAGKANLLNDIGNQQYRNNLACSFNLPPDALRVMKRLPFNSGLTQVESYMSSDKFTNKQQKDFVDLVQSTYLCHPYKGSIDLIYAVARQYKFAYKITNLVPWKLPDDIPNAIDEYQEFLNLVKSNQDLVAVPTIRADLIWHLHMLNPSVYHKETLSMTGRDNIRDLLTFNNSSKVMKKTFEHLMYTKEGFSGTSACGSTEYLHHWNRAEPIIPKEKKDLLNPSTYSESYTKVFRSTGKSPHVPSQVLENIPYNRSNVDVSLLAAFDSMQPNTTEEPFGWEKVSLAWANIFGKTADMEDVRHFHNVQQGGIGASCGVISLHYRRPRKPPRPTEKTPKNHTVNLRDGGGNEGSFGDASSGYGADAGFGDSGGSSGGFGDGGGGGGSSGAGDGGGGGGGGINRFRASILKHI